MLDALFPRMRQKILAALLPAPERRWYLSDLAHHLKVTPSSLQREIASLTEAGILCRETEGNRVYYQANRASPLLPELQALLAKTVGLTAQVQTALDPFWDRIDQAFLFGSVARGERTANSDVDLLIVGSAESADLALPLREVERTLEVPINVIRYTPEEFRDKQQQNNHFLKTVMEGPKLILKGANHELANTADESAS